MTATQAVVVIVQNAAHMSGSTFRLKPHFQSTVSNSDNPQLAAKVKVMLMSTSPPLLAYTADAATSGSLCLIRSGLGRTGNCGVDASVESKWSMRKAGVEVVGDITHLSLDLITN